MEASSSGKMIIGSIYNLIQSQVAHLKETRFKPQSSSLVNILNTAIIKGNNVLNFLDRRPKSFENETESLDHLKDNVNSFISSLNDLDTDKAVTELLTFQLGLLKKSSVKESNSKKSSEVSLDSIQEEQDPQFFHKFTPLCSEKHKIQCQFCEKKYETRRSYIIHMHSQHSKQRIDPNVKDPTGTCKHPSKKNKNEECGYNAPLHKMYNHLQEVHNDPKPKKGFHLRGFYITVTENGVIETESVYLRKEDLDPIVLVKEDKSSSESSEDDLDANNLIKQDKSSNESSEDDLDANDLIKQDKSSNESSEDDLEDGMLKNVDLDPKVLIQKDKSSDYDLESEIPKNVDKSSEESSDEENYVVPKKTSCYNESNEVSSFDNFNQMPNEVLDDSPFATPIISKSLTKRKLQFEDDDIEVSRVKVQFESNGSAELCDLFDSDHEDGDSKDYTIKRMEAKKRRHNLRNQDPIIDLADLEPNKDFIDDMKDYMIRRRVSTPNKNNSTVKKVLNHLFYYEDCLLKYEYKKNEKFNLQKLVTFDNTMLLINDPTDWITNECPDYGSRGLEMLKSHAELRKYLAHKLDNDQCGVSSEAIQKKEALSHALTRISRNVSEAGLFKRYNQLYKKQKAEVDIANQILDIEKGQNEINFVETWKSSKECLKEMEEMDKIFEKGDSGVKIGEREFNKYAQGTRFLFALSDKNRRTTYQLTNRNYINRQPVYFPMDYSGFDNLPENWNIHVPPEDNSEPSQWMIRMSGLEIHGKGHEEITVCITKECAVLMHNYRELKNSILGEDVAENPDKPFFVNFKGEPLCQLQNTRGSLLNKAGKVCGVSNANMTTVRRGLEAEIRGDPAKVARSKTLNNHSSETGRQHYDKTAYKFRPQLINITSNKESPLKETVTKNNERDNRMRKAAEEDSKKRIECAQSIISKARAKKFVKLDKQRRLKPHHRSILQEYFSKSCRVKLLLTNKFPGTQKWKKIWNREIDGCHAEGETLKNLIDIEKELFLNVRNEVEKCLGEWTGSPEQQHMADLKISTSMSSKDDLDNEGCRSEADKNLSALLSELENQYPMTSDCKNTSDPYFVPESPDKIKNQSHEHESDEKHYVSDTSEDSIDIYVSKLCDSEWDQIVKKRDESSNLDECLKFNQESYKVSFTGDDNTQPLQRIKESFDVLDVNLNSENNSCYLVPEFDESKQMPIFSPSQLCNNPTPDIGSNTSTDKNFVSERQTKSMMKQLSSSSLSKYRKRSYSLIKNLRSSSLKKKRKKDENCRFCVRYVMKDEMETHLETFEVCKLLYFRDLKVKTVEGVLTRLWKCLGCSKTGNFYLKNHLKRSGKCLNFYKSKFGVNSVDEISKILLKLSKESTPSRQSTQRNLFYRNSVAKKESEKTISDSINKFKHSTALSNYRVCVKCENHHLESYTIEIDPNNFEHLDLMNKKHLRRGHKFFLCKFCSSADETYKKEECATIMDIYPENGKSIYFPTNGQDIEISNMDSSSFVMIPSSFEALDATNLSNLKLPTYVTDVLNGCKSFTNNDLSKLYLNQLRKYKERRNFDRYVGWIENEPQKMLSSVKQIMSDNDVRSSNSYERNLKAETYCRFKQNGQGCIVVSIGINKQNEETLATSLINQNFVVTIEYIGDENFVQERQYFVHNHDASQDCSQSCKKTEMTEWIQQNNYMSEGLDSKYFATYLSSVYLKMHHFVESFVKATAFDFYSDTYSFNITFVAGECRIEGLLWPKFCDTFNLELSNKSLHGTEVDEIEFLESVSKTVFTITSTEDLMNTLNLSRKEGENLRKLILKHQVHMREPGTCSCYICVNPPLPSLVSMFSKRPEGEAYTNIYNAKELLDFVRRTLVSVNLENRRKTNCEKFLKAMNEITKIVPDSEQNTILVKIDNKELCFFMDNSLKKFIDRFGMFSGIYHYSLRCSEEDNIVILERPHISQCFTHPYNPSILQAFEETIEVKVIFSFSQWEKFQEKFEPEPLEISSDEIAQMSSSHRFGSVLELCAYADSRKIREINSTPVVWVDTSKDPKQRFKKVLEESETTYKLDDSSLYFEPEFSNRLRHFMRLNGDHVLLSEYVVHYEFLGKSESLPIFQIYEKNMDKIKNSEIKSISDNTKCLPEFILSSNGHVAKLRKMKKVLHIPKFVEESEEYKYAQVLLYTNIKPGETIDEENLDRYYYGTDADDVKDLNGRILTAIEKRERLLFDKLIWKP